MAIDLLKYMIWKNGTGGGGKSYEKTVGPAPIISISDAKPKPAKSLIVGMEPIQAGSGDPSPDNIRPISGRTGVTVTRTGENLLPFDDALSDGWTNTLDGVTASYQNGVMHISGVHTTSGWTNIVNISPWTTNPIRLPSGITLRTPSNPGKTSSITMYSRVNGVLRNLTNGSVIDAGSVATVSGFYIAVQGEYTFDFDIPMIVTCGDERPTEYKPYTGASYPVTWQSEAGTVYGCTVDLVSGVLTVTHGIVDLGTLSWTNWGGYLGMYSATVTGMKNPTSTAERTTEIACSSYKLAETVSLNDNMTDKACMRYQDKVIVHDKNYATKETFTNAVDGVQFLYPLATPQTYQLTPQQIQMLKGANVLWSDSDNLTLTYIGTQPSGLLGGMLGGGLGNPQEPEEDPSEEPQE